MKYKEIGNCLIPIEPEREWGNEYLYSFGVNIVPFNDTSPALEMAEWCKKFYDTWKKEYNQVSLDLMWYRMFDDSGNIPIEAFNRFYTLGRNKLPVKLAETVHLEGK